MQDRHVNRKRYFDELAQTSARYYLPYLAEFLPDKIVRSADSAADELHRFSCKDMAVLEIGCGEGGNLLPFALNGAYVLGVDLAANKIENARNFFQEAIAPGRNASSYEFLASDIFQVENFTRKFDLILVHDVIEHIHDKRQFLENCKAFLKEGGLVFVAFPPWQMPFGGHHQMATNKIVSHLPYIHLMHKPFYKAFLKMSGESQDKIDEFMDIKETGISSGRCQKLVRRAGYEIVNRRLYFINPHYEAKFGLRPRRTLRLMSGIPYLRDFLSTSCWLLIRVR